MAAVIFFMFEKEVLMNTILFSLGTVFLVATTKRQ